MESWVGHEVPRLPGRSGPLRLFDSARQGVHPTEPDGAATMYVCGITPYDATHLGHAATMIAFDLVQRMWRDAGHEVRYVQNVTDIDDPLLERAERDGEDWRVLAMRETALFREDMEALRMIPPAHYVGAVESIPDIAEKVLMLLKDGAAYRLDDGTGDVYFDISAAPRFGYESNLSRTRDAGDLPRAWWRPGSGRQARPARPAAVARRPRRRTLLARRRPRAGAAGLAHRVRGDRPGPARGHHRRAGRRQRPALPAPRVFRRARRAADRGGAVRRRTTCTPG